MASNNHLIVGIGGTGGKIIRQLLKTVERNRDTNGQPISAAKFDFLYVDTSSDEIDRKEEWKVLGKEVDLDRSQYLINPAGDIRPVFATPESFPGLKDWIQPESVFEYFKTGVAGAAQRRKLGRLVFARNARAFVGALERRMTTLELGAGKVGAVIHLVCGLAGGTGSGSVVDAVAQIRHKYPDDQLYPILIYALLPEKNSPRAKDVSGVSPYYANGYAALAELNAMAVGKYHPVNVLDGSRMAHDVYFNGCYLVNNINEHNIPFEIDVEVPNIVAEFIFQKTMDQKWDGLRRAEKGENEAKNFESETDGKARAKLFLSFGLKRVVVPEQEIKEYLAYGFAEQAARQLMFNNFREGEGYADEPVQKDFGSEVRRAVTAQTLLLTDVHLMLEAGILDEDAKNPGWKPASEYWKQIVNRLVPDIKADNNLEQTVWVDVLNTRLAKVFDDTYRTLGGVRKFYEVKGNARLEMARHIGRHVEKELFGRWRAGTSSLIQLRQFTDALIDLMEERLAIFQERIAKAPAALLALQNRNTELMRDFNGVGFLGKYLTDKRSSLFSDISLIHQDLYITRTQIEGLKFAVRLIPFINEQLITLRGKIDELHQSLASATARFQLERASRLGATDAAYQKRIFDHAAIESIMKAIVVDEAAQATRTQRVRQAIIELTGTDVDSFAVLADSLSLGSIIATLSQESAAIVELAHAEIARELEPVLQVNIVERLQRRFDANPAGLKDFVRGLYDESGSMLTFNKTEVERNVANNTGGSQGRSQSIGVFLPSCENQKDFRANLAALFDKQKDPTSDTEVSVGSLSNQIVIIKIASLMPVRFIDSLADFKRHYDGLLKDPNESFLLHGEGDGKKLPPLYALTAAETGAVAKRPPYVLLAHVLGLVKERTNKTSGLAEWVFVYEDDGLPAVKVLAGRNWSEVLRADHPIEVQTAIEREVNREVDTKRLHIDSKNDLLISYRALVTKRFNEVDQDDQDPEFKFLQSMQPILRSIIKIPVTPS
jgi:hypothetical protein